MPELPEITAYVEGLERAVVGHPLVRVRLRSPSLLRTWDPPLSAAEGRELRAVRRIGKRVVWEMPRPDSELFLVFHLMVTGRFRWAKPGAAVARKGGHAAFDFPHGTLLLTEAGTAKKATLHLVASEVGLAEFDRGGLEVLDADLPAFQRAIQRENRTLKRALTDPRILSGIGNAHSDEILLAARLSPVQRTRNLTEEEIARLYDAVREELTIWTDRLRAEFADRFPHRITAFHPEMRAHGKYGEPCAQCGSAIQRIVYAERETNYCPTCQTGGKLLADRALSRLLGKDWPRSIEELEDHRSDRRAR